MAGLSDTNHSAASHSSPGSTRGSSKLISKLVSFFILEQPPESLAMKAPGDGAKQHAACRETRHQAMRMRESQILPPHCC